MNSPVWMELHGWLFLGSILLCLGAIGGISLFMALCRREPEASIIRRLKMERSDLKQMISSLREANDDLSHDLEAECNHAHRLVTNQEYYREMTRLDRRVALLDIDNHMIDLRA